MIKEVFTKVLSRGISHTTNYQDGPLHCILVHHADRENANVLERKQGDNLSLNTYLKVFVFYFRKLVSLPLNSFLNLLRKHPHLVNCWLPLLWRGHEDCKFSTEKGINPEEKNHMTYTLLVVSFQPWFESFAAFSMKLFPSNCFEGDLYSSLNGFDSTCDPRARVVMTGAVCRVSRLPPLLPICYQRVRLWLSGNKTIPVYLLMGTFKTDTSNLVEHPCSRSCDSSSPSINLRTWSQRFLSLDDVLLLVRTGHDKRRYPCTILLVRTTLSKDIYHCMMKSCLWL